MTLPKVRVLSLGGTIAMTSSGSGAGVVPNLTGEALVAAVPELADVADVTATSFRTVPGAHLTFADLLALAAEVEQVLAGDTVGVVITQGTDTIEETAFALDLLVRSDKPVIVTGAMRNPTLPGADGPANLLASVQAAASPALRGLGTVVVFSDDIHAARFVRKMHTASTAAFQSPQAGPIGWIAEGRVRVAVRPERGPHVAGAVGGAAPGASADARPEAPAVALHTVTLGDDGRQLEAVASLGYAGLVVEAVGGGHVPAVMVERLAALAAAMPVVLASRTGAGETLRQTYGFPGSEIDLLGRGLIPAGILDGPKARVLLTVLLQAGASREQVAEAFEAYLH